MFREFRDFIARGNVIDLAVAVVIGAAFGKIVTTIVEGIIMPPLGMALSGVDFAGLFYILDTSRGIPASLAEAKAKSIPVIAYGQLFTDMVQFIVVAFVIFLVVKQVNRFKAPPAVTTRDCPLCLSAIPLRATRCAHCTAAV